MDTRAHEVRARVLDEPYVVYGGGKFVYPKQVWRDLMGECLWVKIFFLKTQGVWMGDNEQFYKTGEKTISWGVIGIDVMEVREMRPFFCQLRDTYRNRGGRIEEQPSLVANVRLETTGAARRDEILEVRERKKKTHDWKVRDEGCFFLCRCFRRI